VSILFLTFEYIIVAIFIFEHLLYARCFYNIVAELVVSCKISAAYRFYCHVLLSNIFCRLLVY